MRVYAFSSHRKRSKSGDEAVGGKEVNSVDKLLELVTKRMHNLDIV